MGWLKRHLAEGNWNPGAWTMDVRWTCSWVHCYSALLIRFQLQILSSQQRSWSKHSLEEPAPVYIAYCSSSDEEYETSDQVVTWLSFRSGLPMLEFVETLMVFWSILGSWGLHRDAAEQVSHMYGRKETAVQHWWRCYPWKGYVL